MQERIYYPLSSPQLSIWYTEKMYPGISISNVAGTLRMKDEFNSERLEQAINLFIKNNDGMRLRLCLDSMGLPQQYVSEYQYQNIEFIDFSHNENPVKVMFEWDTEQTKKPFSLLDSALFRFVMIKLSESECGFYINTHHIISDAWSMGLLGSEVIKYYCALKEACDATLESFSSMPSYLTYIQNEQLYKASGRFEKDKLFWKSQFELAPELTVLKSRKSNRVKTESKRKTFIAPEKFVTKLRSYCDENRTSPYPLFLSALSMYLSRATAKEDIVIGTPILNRLNLTEKNTVGMFISTVPLRIKVKGEDSFAALSEEMLRMCSSLYRHQKYPYELILKQVRENHGFQDNLYDLILSYQNSKFNITSDIEYSTRWHFNGHQSNSLTIHINDRDDEGILIFDYDYNTDLYCDKEIVSINQYILTLLWHALDNPGRQACRLEMLPEHEKKQLLYDFNNTASEYPKDKLMHQLFEEQADKTPDNTAIIFEDNPMSYKELNERANSLAWTLMEHGVKPGKRVGLFIHRSAEMVIGILAVLKAGGAYVPLQIEYPDQRIDFIIQDSEINLVLTDDLTDRRILACDTVNVKNYRNYHSSVENPVYNLPSNHLAYIIYTSGTTGEPKGAMVEHRSVINFVTAVSNKIMEFGSQTRVLSTATVCFDFFVFELFVPLLNGSCVVLANELEQRIPLLTGGLISKHRVNKIMTTPSKMKLILSESSNIPRISLLKEIMLGGEALPLDLLRQLKKLTNARIVNGYGPTETTVCVSFKDMTDTEVITVGKPIANTRFYVLDNYMNLVPTGVTGELYIGGAGLAEGYINRSSLTSKSFIQNPFNPSERIYKSGDIAKWMPNGEIALLGRIDGQVKINGLRIELEEIKSHIMKIDGIKDAVVIDQVIQNKKRIICAYILSDNKVKPERIRQSLERILPEYMIPAFITEIPNIPVTINGKIARDNLPKPLMETKKKGITELPQNDLERDIYKTWKDILKVNELNMDDVLYEIGGDSLDSITISSRISKQYGIDLPITEIKEINTIRKMAEYIERSQKNSQENHHLCLLRKGKTNLFFIHAGNGEIDNYISLSELISEEFSCWGIKMDYSEGYPQNITIHDLAAKYLSLIKTVQPEGPYYLAGWCIGGTIAFEMASILEKQNEALNLLGLFNSIAPKNWDDVEPFTAEGEIKFINHYFNTNLSAIIKEAPLTVEVVWRYIHDITKNSTELFNRMKTKIPGEITATIPRFETCDENTFFRYISCIRTLHNARAMYFPMGKIKTDVYYFNAADDTIIKNKEENYKIWDGYCTKTLHQIDIRANHFTLFKTPAVMDLGKKINYLISSSEVTAAI